MDCVVTPLKTLMFFSVHLNVQLKFYNLPSDVEQIITNIKNKLHIATSEEVKHHLLSEKDKQFKSFVKTNFSQDS